MLAAQPSARPNALFIICDDLRPDALGCYGSKHVRTPAIDRLAHQGVHLKTDPGELHNLARDPKYSEVRRRLETQLDISLRANGLTPETDRMPMDEGINSELPQQKIR